MKKLLSIILAIIMIVTTIPFAFAADVVESGNCGANGDNLTWSLDSDGVLTISGEGEMQEIFIYAYQPWEDYAYDIKEVVIEEGVTKIARAAFFALINLEKVTISSTAEFEDFDFCFTGCTSLKEFIVSPANPYYCTDEYGVVFSKDKKTLLKAFDLSDVDYVIPDTVTSVAEEAFRQIKIKSLIVNYTSMNMAAGAEVGKLIVDCDWVDIAAFESATIGELVLTNKVRYIENLAFLGAAITSAHYLGDPAKLNIGEDNDGLTDVLHYCEHKEALVPTCTEIGWEAYEYCTACDYTTYVEIPALGHADADNDGVCDNGCGAEVVTLGGNVYPVDGDITNTGIHIGAFAAFDNCYKAGDGYILIKGEGNDDTVMTLYNATIDVRGTGHKDAIRVDGEDIEIRFFGENNIFADEEAYITAIGSNRHSQTFIGADDAVLNLYGNVSVSDINIESGTVNVYGADVNDIESVYVEGYLVISDGAVLNIISGDNGQGFNCGIIAQKEIVAEGEFNAIALTGVETDNEIIYNLTAIGNAVLGADTYSPYYGMEIPEDMNVEVNFIVPEGASVTVPEGITLNLDSMTNVDIDGELIVYGTLICTHTGGENTCDAPAVCDICGTEYGNIDADNHKDTLVQVDAKAPTCTEIGWDAYEYCTACTYTTYVEKETLKHSFTKYAVTEEAKCGVAGKEVATCDHGCGATDEKAIAALTHKDADGDYKCDNGCGHEFEKPAPEDPTPDTPDEPNTPDEPDTPDEPTDSTCDHLCHKSGILGFFWKIVKFFSKFFKINPVCECGAAHY